MKPLQTSTRSQTGPDPTSTAGLPPESDPGDSGETHLSQTH